jgi:hypothetical protein
MAMSEVRPQLRVSAAECRYLVEQHALHQANADSRSAGNPHPEIRLKIPANFTAQPRDLTQQERHVLAEVLRSAVKDALPQHWKYDGRYVGEGREANYLDALLSREGILRKISKHIDSALYKSVDEIAQVLVEDYLKEVNAGHVKAEPQRSKFAWVNAHDRDRILEQCGAGRAPADPAALSSQPVELRPPARLVGNAYKVLEDNTGLKLGDLLGGRIGAEIRSGHIGNKCAIHLSYGLDAAGSPIPEDAGLSKVVNVDGARDPATLTDKDGKHYFYRVVDVRDHLLRTLGPPDKVLTAKRPDQLPDRPGIVVLHWKPKLDVGDTSTGHATFFNGQGCPLDPEGCYLRRAERVEYWELKAGPADAAGSPPDSAPGP